MLVEDKKVLKSRVFCGVAMSVMWAVLTAAIFLKTTSILLLFIVGAFMLCQMSITLSDLGNLIFDVPQDYLRQRADKEDSRSRFSLFLTSVDSPELSSSSRLSGDKIQTSTSSRFGL